MVFSSFNGKIIPHDNVQIPLSDRGFLYGDGVFTTLCVRDGCVENFSKHLKRLEDHCRALKISYPKIPHNWIQALIIKNEAFDGVWRMKMIITGGSSGSLDLSERSSGNVIITLSKYTPAHHTPYRLALFPLPMITPTAKLKTLSYLNRLSIKDFALNKRAQDALTTLEDGTILETAFSNIFWIEDNVLFTPSFSLPLLRGTYLSTVIDGMKKMGFRIEEKKAKVEDIHSEAHIFLCNSLMGIQPVDSIDEQDYKRSPQLASNITESVKEIISNDILSIEIK